MLAYQGYSYLMISAASGKNISRLASTAMPLSLLPSNCLTLIIGESSFPSSTYSAMDLLARSSSTLPTQSGLDEWMVNKLRVGGRNPLVWPPGQERVVRTLVETSWTTTGMLLIGGSWWGFVECHLYFMLQPSNHFPLGASLERNLRRSFAWSKSQREVANLMSGSYPTPTVDNWRKMRDEFDLDPSKPNPYKEVDNCTCFPIVNLIPDSSTPSHYSG